MASPVAGPGKSDHHHPVDGTRNPRGVRLQIGGNGTHIERPPTPPPLTVVIPATTTRAHPAATAGTPPRAHRGHDGPLVLVENHPFHHRALDTEQPLPYLREPHAVPPPSTQPQQPEIVGVGRRAHSLTRSGHPRKRQKSHKFDRRARGNNPRYHTGPVSVLGTGSRLVTWLRDSPVPIAAPYARAELPGIAVDLGAHP